MRTTIGIYEDHDQALEAVSQLKASGYPLDNLTIMGKTETEEIAEDMRTVPKEQINAIGLGAGTAIGATVGILTGIGIFAIPGLGFLFGAGALVGAIAGIDFGLIGGGIASVLTTAGLQDETAKKYQTELEEGKFLVIAQGTDEELARASAILETHGTHSELDTH